MSSDSCCQFMHLNYDSCHSGTTVHTLSLSSSHQQRARLKALLVILQTSRCETFDAARCNYIHFALKMTNLSLNDVHDKAIDGIAYGFGEIYNLLFMKTSKLWFGVRILEHSTHWMQSWCGSSVGERKRDNFSCKSCLPQYLTFNISKQFAA